MGESVSTHQKINAAKNFFTSVFYDLKIYAYGPFKCVRSLYLF